MRILLTNDDGYRAEGISILAKRLSNDHIVSVVAPKKEKSGASHSMTFYRDVNVQKVNQFDWECYHIDGTPVDCVRFGAEVLMADRPPELILSGINNEANVGTDILYSGTFHAAMQGYLRGFRSVAISTDGKTEKNFEAVADFVAEKITKLQDLAQYGAVNVNYPSKTKKLLGTRFASVGKNEFTDEYIVQKLNGGRLRYKLIGDPIQLENNPENCDVVLFQKGYVTVSVIHHTFQENLHLVEEGYTL